MEMDDELESIIIMQKVLLPVLYLFTLITAVVVITTLVETPIPKKEIISEPINEVVTEEENPSILSAITNVLPKEKEPVEEEVFEKGLVYANVLNIRKEPTTESDIIGHLSYETEILYKMHDPEWARLKGGGYVYAKYIVDELPYLKKIGGINDKRKSWMDYRAITSPSQQKKLQQVCETFYGLRTYQSRFCVAMGSGLCNQVGTYVDVILENGTLIKCIVGDAKADAHTQDSSHKVGLDGSAIEFIVDRDELPEACLKSGDISDMFGVWKDSVREVRIYDYRVTFE